MNGALRDLRVDHDVVEGSSQGRPRGVYNKMSILKHAHTIANVVLMADLDIMCTQDIEFCQAYRLHGHDAEGRPMDTHGFV